MNCPVCANANACEQTCGSGRKTCWCFDIRVPKPLIDALAESEITYACLCRQCLTSVVAHHATGATPTEAIDLLIAERQLVTA